MHINESLLLIGKSSESSGSSGFPLSLSEWSFAICLTQYNRIKNVLNASLNKTFPSYLPIQDVYITSSYIMNNTCKTGISHFTCVF